MMTGNGIYRMSSSSADNWRKRADCQGKDLGLFFDQYATDTATADDVDDLCFGCPVQRECLEMGINTAGTGVHGGVYLILGQYSKAKNAHKTAQKSKELNDQIAQIKGILEDE